MTGYENTVSVLLKYDANQFQKNNDGKDAYASAEELNNKTPVRQHIFEMMAACY